MTKYKSKSKDRHTLTHTQTSTHTHIRINSVFGSATVWQSTLHKGILGEEWPPLIHTKNLNKHVITILEIIVIIKATIFVRKCYYRLAL